MAKYRVTGNNLYGLNGKIKVGEAIDVEGELPAGWKKSVTLIEESTSVTSEPRAASVDPDRLELFRTTVDQLSVDDMTKDGKPKLDALNAALPSGAVIFTTEERDELVAALAE